MARLGFGPVFAADCLTTSRRWQVYAGRAVLVGCLLAGLGLMWWSRFQGIRIETIQALAQVGEAFFRTIMAVELVLALLVVPAATAGAICQEKVRGNLTLTLVTDLSDSEIVLGKLAARLLTIVGVLACSTPVLAIATSLGGVDPADSLGGMLVILAVAVLGATVALTFSVWARKPHEALMATYAVWAVWLLAPLALSEMLPGRPSGPAVFAVSPFWLTMGHSWGGGPAMWTYRVGFLAACVLISLALAGLSTWKIRAVTVRQMGEGAGRAARRRRSFGPGVSLDRNPILWREVHRRRPSAWSRGIWWLYGVLSAVFCVLALVGVWTGNPWNAAGVNGFQVSIGLLMVSVTAATALAEERAHGSLDVLLTTPLPTREIVGAKWWGAFRPVPWLAVLPALLMLGYAVSHQRGPAESLFAAGLMALVVLAYGAAIASLGLALAAWQRRLGRAVALTVGAYLLATVVWPAVALMLYNRGPDDSWELWGSPFFGAYIPFFWRGGEPTQGWLAIMALATAAVFGLFAGGLYLLTLARFERLVGRMPEAGAPRPAPAAVPAGAGVANVV